MLHKTVTKLQRVNQKIKFHGCLRFGHVMGSDVKHTGLVSFWKRGIGRSKKIKVKFNELLS